MSVKLSLSLLAAALAAGTMLSAQAAGVVEVRFVQSQHYSDAGRTNAELERTTQALEEHLKHFAKRLPEGQTLRVDVLDVDLAGYVKPTRRGDVRVLNGGADWPRLKLRYALAGAGSTLQSGEETLKDMDYFFPQPYRLPVADLPYEKRMLDTWFRERFAAATAP